MTLTMFTPEEYDDIVKQVMDRLADLQLRAPYRACQLIARDMEKLGQGLERQDLNKEAQ